MKTTIAKHFDFDAAHFLPTVPKDHKCARMHGHSYRVELRFLGSTAATGFCAGIDYADIAKSWAVIHDKLDHRTLNDVPGLAIPTTENLVEFIICSWRAIAPVNLAYALDSVKVSESTTTWCEGTVAEYLAAGGQ